MFRTDTCFASNSCALASGESSALENFHFISFTSPPPFQNFRSIFHHLWVFSEISRRSNTPKRQLNILKNNKRMKNSSFWVVFIVMHIAFPFSNFLFENNRKMALLVSSHLDRLNSLIFNYPSFPRCRFSFSNTGDLNFLNIQSVK